MTKNLTPAPDKLVKLAPVVEEQANHHRMVPFSVSLPMIDQNVQDPFQQLLANDLDT